MKQIRMSIFETNSSSTHVFSMFDEKLKSTTEKLDSLVNNKELMDAFKYNIFQNDYDEINISYWCIFNDFQYSGTIEIESWKSKLDFWLQAIIQRIVDFDPNRIAEIEEKNAKHGINTNNKLFKASYGYRVVQNIWVNLVDLLGFNISGPLTCPELNISDVTSLNYEFHNNPIDDEYLVLDINKNIIGLKKEVLERIALNILDPKSYIVTSVYDFDPEKFKAQTDYKVTEGLVTE